jgi:hypothetical protein
VNEQVAENIIRPCEDDHPWPEAAETRFGRLIRMPVTPSEPPGDPVGDPNHGVAKMNPEELEPAGCHVEMRLQK